MPTPPRIIIGVHPHAGWRSFSTDKKLLADSNEGAQTVMVYADGLILSLERQQTELTHFGASLLEQLSENGYTFRFVRFKRYHAEVYVDVRNGWSSEGLVLRAIACAYSFGREWIQERRDMTGGQRPTWSADFTGELEETEQLVSVG